MCVCTVYVCVWDLKNHGPFAILIGELSPSVSILDRFTDASLNFLFVYWLSGVSNSNELLHAYGKQSSSFR